MNFLVREAPHIQLSHADIRKAEIYIKSRLQCGHYSLNSIRFEISEILNFLGYHVHRIKTGSTEQFNPSDEIWIAYTKAIIESGYQFSKGWPYTQQEMEDEWKEFCEIPDQDLY